MYLGVTRSKLGVPTRQSKVPVERRVGWAVITDTLHYYITTPETENIVWARIYMWECTLKY